MMTNSMQYVYSTRRIGCAYIRNLVFVAVSDITSARSTGTQTSEASRESVSSATRTTSSTFAAAFVVFIYLYSSKNDSNQTNRKEQKNKKKLDSEHNIENTVTYMPT